MNIKHVVFGYMAFSVAAIGLLASMLVKANHEKEVCLAEVTPLKQHLMSVAQAARTLNTAVHAAEPVMTAGGATADVGAPVASAPSVAPPVNTTSH